MKLSIILATRDRPDWLPRAIASVQAQTDPRWELVVLDNGESIAHLLPDDARIRYAHATASGPAHAYDQALALATGEVVMPLADDDTLAPQTVAVVLDAIEGHEWGYAQTDYLRDGEHVLYLGEAWDVARLRTGYYLGGAVFWRKRLSDRLGGFDATYDHAADWDLYLRFGEDSEPVVLPDILYRYTDWPGTDTNRNNDRQWDANHRIAARSA